MFRDPGIGKVQTSEIVKSGKLVEMFQSGVADLRAAEIQGFQIGQETEILQPVVVDLRSAEIQRSETAEPTQVQSNVGDLSATEVQVLEIL